MSDTIDRQAAIDALDVLCQEHRYRIPGKRETYSQYNEAWQDALDRAEGAIGNLPSAQPEIIRCKDCKWWGREDVFEDGSSVTVCKKGLSANPEGFCHYAEMREGEQDE